MQNKTVKTLPDEFIKQLETVLDGQGIRDFRESLENPTPTSIRYNIHKPASVPSGLALVPWCSSACYLPERPSFTLDPRFHAGAY